MIRRYDTYADFLTEVRTCSGSADHFNREFHFHRYDEAEGYAKSGDDSLVSEADKLISQLEQLESGVAVTEWTPSVCGAYPIVPEFIAGHPQCMRALAPSDRLAPVSIYACTTISAAVSQSQLMKRGTAILALVMALQKTRSVDLYLTAETHGAHDGDYIQVIPLESRPLSLAHACYGLTSAGFARQLTYTIANHRDHFNGQWGKHYHMSGYDKWISKQLQLTPDDLYIKAGYINDPLIDTPVEWINEQLQRYNTTP